MHNIKSLFFWCAFLLGIFTGECSGEEPGKTTLLFFYTPTCHRCVVFKDALSGLSNDGLCREIDISYRNVADIDNYSYLMSLLTAHKKPEKTVFPVLYLNGHFLDGNAAAGTIRGAINDFIRNSLARPGPAVPARAFDIKEYARGIGIWAILGAGLIDGINPCAFTTLIFFMSFLSLQGYSRRNILYSGISYIAGVFCAYIVIGLGLLGALYGLRAFWTISAVLNIGIGCFSIILGMISVMDAVRFGRSGASQEIILQLPKSIKTRLHALIHNEYKTSGRQDIARRKNFIVLAVNTFFLGVVIAVFESACTGQIYLPTLMLILAGSGAKMLAFLNLVAYNAIFVTPLVGVLAMSYMGVTSEWFVTMVKKHLTIIKYLLAVTFFVLGGFLLYTYIPLAHANPSLAMTSQPGGTTIAGADIKTKDVEFSFNFGKVSEGKVLKHVFVLRNTSRQLMKIKQVNSSCACTTSDLSSWEIAPGGVSRITVQFNTRGYPGEKERYVYIHTDNSDRPIIMYKIQATVIPETKKQSEEGGNK
ncbi:MAG: DUF1573 domain-containing protein [Candidatus Omnitrophica bacterium]|nr:DUF1573 domain-containing protein [Candidatus Omnitrophota bacterium]